MPSQQASAHYWSRVAREKTFGHPLDVERFARHVPRTARVLDLGAGYGRLTAELAEHGWTNVVGADRASGMVTLAKERHPGLEFVELDAAPGARLPFSDESFDAVLLFSVLTCVPEDHELDALFGEIERVLAPRGVLHVSDLLLQTDARNTARYDAAHADGAPYGTFDLPEGVRLRHFDLEGLRARWRAFEELDLIEHDVVTMNGNAAHGFQFLGRLVPSEPDRPHSR